MAINMPGYTPAKLRDAVHRGVVITRRAMMKHLMMINRLRYQYVTIAE